MRCTARHVLAARTDSSLQGEAKAEVIPATHANEAANLSAESAGVADPEVSPETADKTTEPATEVSLVYDD